MTEAEKPHHDEPPAVSRLSPMQQHQDHLRRQQHQAQQALTERRWHQAQAQQLQLAPRA